MAEQIELFSDFIPDNPDDHWVGMPEFVQESKESVANVVVHFETLGDLEEFNRVTGLSVTPQTKGIYFPHRPSTKKVYVDEP